MNKPIIAILLTVCLLISCKKHKSSKHHITKIQIDKNEINLGDISLTDTIVKTISVINIGVYPLIIDSVGVSCGCTIVKYDKTPKEHNEKTEIAISFIPTELGAFKKSVIIEANTSPHFNIIYLKGKVKL